MKTIIRTKRTSGFTILPNETLRDKTLSFRARGLLAFVLSHSEEWEVTKEWLRHQGSEGIDALTTAMRELVDRGYAERQVEKHPKTGKILRHIWVFRDTVQNAQKDDVNDKSPMFIHKGKNHSMETHPSGFPGQRRNIGKKKHFLGSVNTSPKKETEKQPEVAASDSRYRAPLGPSAARRVSEPEGLESIGKAAFGGAVTQCDLFAFRRSPSGGGF